MTPWWSCLSSAKTRPLAGHLSLPTTHSQYASRSLCLSYGLGKEAFCVLTFLSEAQSKRHWKALHRDTNDRRGKDDIDLYNLLFLDTTTSSCQSTSQLQLFSLSCGACKLTSFLSSPLSTRSHLDTHHWSPPPPHPEFFLSKTTEKMSSTYAAIPRPGKEETTVVSPIRNLSIHPSIGHNNSSHALDMSSTEVFHHGHGPTDGETYWFCGECREGPYGSWIPCCLNCGHQGGAYCAAGTCIVESR